MLSRETSKGKDVLVSHNSINNIQFVQDSEEEESLFTSGRWGLGGFGECKHTQRRTWYFLLLKTTATVTTTTTVGRGRHGKTDGRGLFVCFWCGV